jgi:penicillin amidase
VRLRFVLSAVAAVLLVVLLVFGFRPPAPLPPLGPLLDPVYGALGTARDAELPRQAIARIPGLRGTVDVRYDGRGVPHIFAGSELDAVRALGYIVARDRLFQLEIQARSGAGRLTELVGGVALPLDREMRGLGLPDAARRRLELLSPAERALLNAFSSGVNAWIDGLGRRRPLEYLLLGRRPGRWSPINSLHLSSRMGWTLAHSDLEDLHRRAAARLGEAAADALYPSVSPIQEPLQPNGQASPRYSTDRLPPPPAQSSALRSSPTGNLWADSLAGFDGLGSNNWAVAPGRSASGYALLAGDQHLELTLPAIWYEVHLVVPDSLDVYGVTIPGAPGVLIGFNREVAWTFTNTEADVLDQYQEIVDDSASPTRYRLDGSWRPLRVETEQYLDPAGRLLAVDTLRYSHRGPLQRAGEGWRSLRWTVLEAGPSSLFNRAARAGSARAWLDSMATFQAPAQNMLVADRQGTIAIRSTGRLPLRPGGRGDLVQRGDSSRFDWTGDWTLAELPQAINPAQGYLASANQQPIDPRMDPRYLGANWLAPWRAIRINELLRGDSAVTVDAMRLFQTDPVSAAAEVLLPILLAAGGKAAGNDTVQRAVTLLRQWDGRYTRDNTRAVLYETTIRQLQRLLWDELGPDFPPPSMSVTMQLTSDPTSPWWDDRRTAEVEDRDRLLARALAQGLSETIRQRGEPDAGGWRWDRIRRANIYHLLRIPSLSALNLPIQAGQSTLNPSSGRGDFGPSWRMVVELGPELRAWGTYPGGESGNPASSRYLSGLDRWKEGTLEPLRFPRSADQLVQEETSRLTLTPIPASP